MGGQAERAGAGAAERHGDEQRGRAEGAHHHRSITSITGY